MRASLLILVMCLACGPKTSSSDGGNAGTADAGSNLEHDAGSPVYDGGTADAAVAPDAGPTGSGAVCTFNADCPAAERCECEEATGCFCYTGTRGAGHNGVDVCISGNDCDTALCVEGNGGPFYCSGPCASAGDCASHLPLCSNIAFIGMICIRSPDGGV